MFVCFLGKLWTHPICILTWLWTICDNSALSLSVPAVFTITQYNRKVKKNKKHLLQTNVLDQHTIQLAVIDSKEECEMVCVNIESIHSVHIQIVFTKFINLFI